jgi:lipopolysaccharide/colanic/teichoic acid biosynthesis glycosyltransferase
MELVLQAPPISLEQTKRKVAVYDRLVLRIENMSRSTDKVYHQDQVCFNNVTIREACKLIESGELAVDAILLHPDAITGDVFVLKEIARKASVPLIVYTPIFDPTAKGSALTVNADDYHYGTISSAFFKRVDFIKKVKSYKVQRGNKPYAAQALDAVPQIKLWSLKRAFDVVVSATALLILSPICLLIAAIVKLESKGPVFYISKRAGSGYKIFNFYKFRSMRTGSDAELQKLAHLNQYSASSNTGVFFKIKNDPRITRFGEFIRKTSLDEIPQLVNVLIGDMSLVGNRPLPLYEAEKLTKDQIAWRFLAPAGITGLWQITKRGKDNMSEDERIALDMEYAMKNSFWLDMKILLSTIPALLQKEKV